MNDDLTDEHREALKDWADDVQELSDEVERLREEVKLQNGWAHDQLREVERLREALREIAHGGNGMGRTVSAPQFASEALASDITALPEDR